MLRKTIILACLSSLLPFGFAYAHPALEASSPAQGATVPSPKEIRLTFTESIILKFSGLTVRQKGGDRVETGSSSTDPNNKRQLVVPVSNPLAPGTYEVDWNAVSADTHRVSGHFSFTVAQ